MDNDFEITQMKAPFSNNIFVRFHSGLHEQDKLSDIDQQPPLATVYKAINCPK